MLNKFKIMNIIRNSLSKLIWKLRRWSINLINTQLVLQQYLSYISMLCSLLFSWVQYSFIFSVKLQVESGCVFDCAVWPLNSILFELVIIADYFTRSEFEFTVGEKPFWFCFDWSIFFFVDFEEVIRVFKVDHWVIYLNW